MTTKILLILLFLFSSTSFAVPISSKWIGLDNNTPLKFKNSSGVAVDVLRLDSSNEIQMLSSPIVATPKSAPNALITNSQVDTKVTAYSTPTNARLTAIESLNTTQDGRLGTGETTITSHATRLNGIDTLNTTQNTRLTNIETLNTTQTGRLDGIDTLNTTQTGRLDTNDTTNTTQNNRLTAVEAVATNYSIRASTQVASSATAYAGTDMTLTPLVTGTYLVLANLWVNASTATSRNATVALYNNNTLVTGSDFILAVTNTLDSNWSFYGILNLTANQVINIRWFTNGGTIQARGRSLVLVKL